MSVTKSGPNPSLDEELGRVLVQMSKANADSDEYAKMLTHYERLYKIRYPKRERALVDPNVVIGAFANIGGIGMILGFERAHVLTSKALGFVTKTRV